MSPFEFFFTFYGLLLGFSLAELVGGFARLLHERGAIRFGMLTPMLAVFVAIDIATFWNQAWVILRHAPFNLALLVLGLLVACIFYVAATLVFPRDVRTQALDDHFWTHRRVVLMCVLVANWIMGGTFLAMAGYTGELQRMSLGPVFWGGLALFSTGTLVAAFALGRWIVMTALGVLLAYHAFTVGRAGLALINAGGWSMLGPAPS